MPDVPRLPGIAQKLRLKSEFARAVTDDERRAIIEKASRLDAGFAAELEAKMQPPVNG